MMVRRQISILATLLLLSSFGPAADWPRFLGPNNDSSSPETKLLHEWPQDGPRKLWEYPQLIGHQIVCELIRTPATTAAERATFAENTTLFTLR